MEYTSNEYLIRKWADRRDVLGSIPLNAFLTMHNQLVWIYWLEYGKLNKN